MTSPKGNSQTASTRFEQILTELSGLGSLDAAILATSAGLPIATSPSSLDAQLTAAMVAMLRKVSKDARAELGMDELDEVSLYDRKRSRLACRFFWVDQEELILALLVKEGARYRRLSGHAIRRIQQAWTG
ncbi:MAG TPA: roadblock/LC7 domain-containing protein [Anaerolineae bacterium]|nr:roadblock/LC7 domain-containing protein [Anaerolineae bacterium]